MIFRRSSKLPIVQKKKDKVKVGKVLGEPGEAFFFAATYLIKQINGIYNRERPQSCVLQHFCTPQSHCASPRIT